MNLKTLFRNCPICNCTEGEVLHTQKFILSENHPLRDGYDVVYCGQCGFCFADTIATQRDYDEFYANFSKYSDNKTSSGGGGNPTDLERIREMAAEIGRVGDCSARIVDIGCANGGLLRELCALGFARLCGIDPSSACAEQTRIVSGAEAFAGTLFNMPVEAGTFDGVILSHVLEHVRDLTPALIGLRRFMNAGAWLYVETPDATHYKDCLTSPFQDFNTEHINHFSPASMLNLLRQCGFNSASQGQKTIFSAPGMPYPALFVFAELGPDHAPSMAITKDEELKGTLLDYIVASRRIMDGIEEQLQSAISRHPELIVWGTGQLTMKLLGETSLARANIVAFVDSNPANQGKLLRGVPVVTPQSLVADNVPILVASTINAGSILASIRQLNLPNPIIRLAVN